jgi:hypothetical protein
MVLRIVATRIASEVDGDIAQIRGQPGRLAPRVWSAWRRNPAFGAAPPCGLLERQRS